MQPKFRRPTSPAEMLAEEFLGLSLDEAQGVFAGKPITQEIANKLAVALGCSPEVWLNLQAAINAWDAAPKGD